MAKHLRTITLLAWGKFKDGTVALGSFLSFLDHELTLLSASMAMLRYPVPTIQVIFLQLFSLRRLSQISHRHH